MIDALAQALLIRGWTLATAESCTGGLVAAACTEHPGASAWFDRGFVTYSNAAKTELLGVEPALLEVHGAVSEAVARAMAEGALHHSSAHVAVSVTGIAGPGGATVDKPVGTVWIAWALKNGSGMAQSFYFEGDRSRVRAQASEQAIVGLCALFTHR